MKKRKIKRIVYYAPTSGDTFYGATEYDGDLDDYNILGAFHEVDKTAWIGNSLWTLRAGVPAYRITVETFYQYQKRWYELMLDAVRRI